MKREKIRAYFDEFSKEMEVKVTHMAKEVLRKETEEVARVAARETANDRLEGFVIYMQRVAEKLDKRVDEIQKKGEEALGKIVAESVITETQARGAIKVIQETAFNGITEMKERTDRIEASNERFHEMMHEEYGKFQKEMRERNEAFEKRIDEKVDRIEKRMDQMDEKMDRMEKRMDQMDEKMDRMEKRMDRIEKRMDQMDEKMDRILDFIKEKL